jgi:hypothetical protein
MRDKNCNMHRKHEKTPKGRDRLAFLGIDGRIILKWILEGEDVNVRIQFNWLRTLSNDDLSYI